MATINVTLKDRSTNLGIENGIIVLYDILSNTQITLTTNASGVASFTGVAIGNYSVYNTYIAPDATPPTICGFPPGYNGTTYARRLDVVITTTTQTTALSFNFDKPVPWSTFNSGNPPNNAILTQAFVNLATGAITAITPNIANNGIGYSLADNLLYGYAGRSDTTSTIALNYPNPYTLNSAVGDCDANSYFYAPVANGRFTCIDVDPTRTTYLRAVNPYTNFSEVKTSPYTVSYTVAPNQLTSFDWSYVPSVSGIVAADSNANKLWILSLTTPVAYNLPVIGQPLVHVGVSVSDYSNYYQPTGTRILKFAITPTVANGSILSLSSGNGVDGTRAVTAPVFYAQPLIKKLVSSKYATIGDTLTFTVTISNLGVTTGNNAIFQDTLPEGVSFVNDSVYLNGVQQTGITPSFIELGTLPLKQVFTINFKALVTTNTIPVAINSANVTTSYLDQATGLTFTTTFASNTTVTTLPVGEITSTKAVNTTSATIGDTLNYTIVLKNTGTVTATNCTILDTTPNGTSFITNSLQVNGVTVTGGTLFPTGFNVGTIASGKTTTITFNAKIVSIPTQNPIPNSASGSFKYVIDPTTIPNRIGNGGLVTNIVTTQVNYDYASLSGITKLVNNSYAKVGDILLYTILLPNTGNTTALNVILTDTIPIGTTFVSNSITLNDSTQIGAIITPPTGFTVGNISSNTTSTVTFKVTVTTIPTVNPIINSAVTNFKYFYTTTISSGAISNIVSTTIVDAILSQVKTVNKTNAFVGDILTYTIVLKNSGNTTANNVIFVDTVPTQTSFITDSLTINGVTQTGLTPNPPGILIPSIEPNGVVTISFNASIPTIPNTNPFANISSTGFNFISNPSTGETTNKNSNSNQVSTFVNPNSNPLKIVSDFSGKVGDVLTYTILFLNSTAVTVTTVTLFDTIPIGTTLVPNSIQVNGVATTGTLAPPTGLTIPDVAPNNMITLTFNVTVSTLPTINPLQNTLNMTYTNFGDPTLKSILTNTVSTEINEAILSPAIKSVNKDYATVGDTLTYTIAISNTGNVTALNVLLTDTIPNGTSFILDSIYLNGINVPGTTVDPSSGFNIGTIPVNGTSTVTFNLLVTTIPNPNPIINNSTLNYDYIFITSIGQLTSGGANTNSTSTQVNFANIMHPTKVANKDFTAVPSIITYTIAMQNFGNTTALNLVFSDTIPTGTTFIANSVTLNGVTQSGAVVTPPGFNIGTLAAGAITTLTFQVNVSTIPTQNPILNSGTTNYSYIINPSTSTTGTGSGNTSIASTQVIAASLAGVIKLVDRPYATCGDSLIYTIIIPNSGNTTALNVVVFDTIPNGLLFTNNSLYVNGIQQVGVNPSLGVTIPNIAPGATATLTFSVQVQC